MASKENQDSILTNVREVSLRGRVIRFKYPGEKLRISIDDDGRTWMDAGDFTRISTAAEYIQLDEQIRSERKREIKVTEPSINPNRSFTEEEFAK